MSIAAVSPWPTAVFRELKALVVQQVAWVPDAGHEHLIELCRGDAGLTTVPLTTEEEGPALLAGAWLGGQRGVLLMQSSGVGNCVNALASITRACRFPLLVLVTMRGEWGEGNPWQVPMGQATAPVLASVGVRVRHVERGDEAAPAVAALGAMVFETGITAAVLFGQRLVGAKQFR